MTEHAFASYAQNGEDVVLHRALRSLPSGRYVEVGANHPVIDSISWSFYQRGWRGVTVEPMAVFTAEHRRLRPGDVQVEAVIGDVPPGTVDRTTTFFEIPGTGLSTTDDTIAAEHRTSALEVVERAVPVRRLDDVLDEHLGPDDEIHFLVVDTEGSEHDVLAGLDLARRRPWVMVVESTAPNSSRPTFGSWEGALLAAGYEFCLFDGLSRFYVAEEHRAEFAPALSYPACVLDDFDTAADRAHAAELAATTARLAEAEQGLDVAIADLVRWRTAALTTWQQSGRPSEGHVRAVQDELDRVRGTVSWRLTRPLRSVRTRAGALLR